MRAVRALARGNEIEFGFASEASKKCSYCTLMNEKCRPVPMFAGQDFEELRLALERRSAAWTEDEEELEGLDVGVKSAAFRLATTVQVATAQVSGLNVADLLVDAHYQQQEALAEMKALRLSVAELTGVVTKLVDALGATVFAPGRGNTRGGRGGDRGQSGGGTGVAPLSASGGLDGTQRPTEVDDSELSNAASSMIL